MPMGRATHLAEKDLGKILAPNKTTRKETPNV